MSRSRNAPIKEIIINLVGSEELAIFERREDYLVLAGSFGIDEQELAVWPAHCSGWIGTAVRDNRIFVRKGEASSIDAENNLTACVPLRLADEVIGAVAVFRLLPHKPALESVDLELFDLLATHGGMALYTTALHSGRVTPLTTALEAV